MTTMTAATATQARTRRLPHIAADDLTAYALIGDEDAKGGGARGDMDALVLYLDEVRRHPLLSGEEERALLAAVRSVGGGGESDPDAARAARARLCACNLRLVVSIAVRYRAVPGIDLLDLIQEGTIGLLHAIATFDQTRASRLSTHATWWVWQAISRAIGDQARTIRLPIHVRTSLNAIRHTRRALTQSLLREPTMEEIAAEVTRRLGRPLSAEQARALETAVLPVVSLDMPLLSDDSTSSTIGELIGDDGGLSDAGALGADPAERSVDAVTHAATVAWLLDAVMDEWAGARVELRGETRVYEPLTARERVVLRLRYGLEMDAAGNSGGGGTTSTNGIDLLQTGKRLSISRERVRQIQQTALDKLRMLTLLLGLDVREVL